MKFKNFTKSKKGELTTKQLVTIIILIVSFIIILVLLFRLNLGETTDKEVCHNSVVLKEKSGALSGALDCRTNYLCISGGKSCKGIPTSSTVKINLNKEDEFIKNETMKALADEMSDCWWMFGEGEVKYESGFFVGKVHCALCSILTFDEKIQGKIPEITYSEFYEFLKITKKDETKTYLQSLYGVDDIAEIKDNEYFNVDLATGVINIKEKQTIITGVDMNPNIPIIGKKDRYLRTFIIPTSKTSLTKCNEYITKA